jgi:hypothetical protein
MRPPRSSKILPLLLAVVAGCGGGSSGDPDNRGPFKLNLISTGQGQVFPYRILAVDGFGNPTSNVINIESDETLRANVNANNPVLPVAALPDLPELPNGNPGNQFLHFRFSHKLEIDSILSPNIANAQTNSGLTTALSVIAYDPTTENTTVLKGRGFVGGQTYFNDGGRLDLVEAVTASEDSVTIGDARAEGFPLGFTGDVELVSPKSFVFVADSDGDLSTIETFDPLGSNVLIRIQVTNSILDSEGKILEQEVCTATTVGNDPNPADVLGWAPTKPVQISPGNSATNVDPFTDIVISFNKPVQPSDVGTFFSTTNLTPSSGGVSLSVSVAASSYTIIYYADPVSYSDLCNYRIRPAYALPGEETINVLVQGASVRSLKDLTPLGNDAQTAFQTGVGAGVVNAPVCPDAIYVGIGGAEPGISIIDLNGYGQGTNGLEPDENGNPTKDPLDTYFAQNNPNIGQPGMTPSLAPGTSTLDAGSNGPLTLVEDTRGNTKLLRSPTIGQIGDMHVGAPLDLVYNNSNVNVNVNGANQVNPATGFPQPGNCVAVSTHPNPPRLVFPPPNVSRAIFAEEPTRGGSNLLNSGTRPDYRDRAFSGFFGPAAPPPSPPPPPQFLPYQSRQQIGHFLYVLDRENRQVLVMNSNRLTILDRIRLSDPYRIAFSPSLGVMAVSNLSSSTVEIVNTDPRSPSFHQIVAQTRVPAGPTEIVWQPDGEAILTICSVDSSLAIINASDFSLQKVVSGNIVDPLGLVVTERYVATGNTSNVFYGYILNGNGSVAVYESGPDGTNGIGFNDMVGLVQPSFTRARAIKMDWTSGFGGFWISHVDNSGVAVVSRCELTTSPAGPQPTQQQTGTGFLLPPTFRQKEWTVTEKYGGASPSQPLNQRFTGNSVADFAFDEMFNQGSGTNQLSQFNGALGTSILGHSAKGAVMNGIRPFRSSYLFVALGDVGKIDVIDVVARIRVTTLDVPGVSLLSTYWRQ